jgi:hypothetical protein
MAGRMAGGCGGSIESSAELEDPVGFVNGAGRPLGVEERSSEANDFVSGAGFTGFLVSVIASSAVAGVATRVVVSGPSARS